MNLVKLLTISMFFTTLVSATIYESGEDGVEKWKVYDANPTGATIENLLDRSRMEYVFDDSDENTKVIQLKGEGRKNSYELGARKGDRAWKNSSEKVIHWKMSTKEKYKIYVYAQTKEGYRKFYFSPSQKDKGFTQSKSTGYIHVGLGKVSMDGHWHGYVYNLKTLLKKFEPNNEIVTIDGFRVTGSMFIDDIVLDNKDVDIYPQRNRTYTQDKKYFYLFKSKTNPEESIYQFLDHFVVESSSNKLVHYKSGGENYKEGTTIKHIENSDIFVHYNNGGSFYTSYYFLDKNGLTHLDIKEPDTDNWYAFDKAIVNDSILKVTYTVSGEAYDKLSFTYDISNLPKVKLLSSSQKDDLKISNINVIKLRENYAKVSWKLNNKGTGQVEYGTTMDYGNFTKKENSFKYKAHRQSLRGLTPHTTYHYRVISEDKDGKRVVSNDNSFTTK